MAMIVNNPTVFLYYTEFYTEDITFWVPLFVLVDFYPGIRDMFIYQAYWELMFYLFRGLLFSFGK